MIIHKFLLNLQVCILLCCFFMNCYQSSLRNPRNVYVYHFMVPHWGSVHEGVYNCTDIDPMLHCEWTQSDHARVLRERMDLKQITFDETNSTVTVGVYNVHSLWEKLRWVHPPICELPTNLTLVESEESTIRYKQLFDASFKNFDGISTTSPHAEVQRVYYESFLYDLNLSIPLRNFTSLIQGSSYVASDCHRHDKANANRDGVVHILRQQGIRIDGLGRCMKSQNSEGISLVHTGDSYYNLLMKREAIGRYLFHMAFENSIEPGYVTEKPFDALIAGTVPVYLGDDTTLKEIIPDPKSVIFVADFKGNLTELALYLKYLESNETAYEEHRNWRKTFMLAQYHRSKRLLRHSWECRICAWAADAASKQQIKPSHECHHQHRPIIKLNISEYEGKAVKGTKRTVYYIDKGLLRLIPDFDTFTAMKLSVDKIHQLSNEEIAVIPSGEAMPKLSP